MLSTNGYRKYTIIWWMLAGLSTWLVQPIVATTPSPVCTVTTLTAGTKAETSITVTWSVNEGVQGDCSNIQLCVSPPPSQGSPCQTGTGDTTTFNTLGPGTDHTVNLTVTASNSNSASQTVDQKTLPSAPTITTVSRGAPPQTVLTVTWSNPDGAFDSFNLLCSGDGTDHTFNDVRSPAECTGLTAGTLYTATVTTVSGSDQAPSDPVKSYTGLNAPSISSVGPTTTDTITVVWAEPGGGYDKTVLECTGGGQDDTVEVDNPGTTGTCDSLTPGAVYNVTVRSRIDSTDPPAPPDSAIDSRSQITVPTEPTIGSVSQDTTSISITLTPGPGQCSEYKISYRLKDTSDLTEMDPVTCTPGSPTTDVPLNGLETNTEYTIQIVTVSATGTGLTPTESTPATTDDWTAPEAAPKPTTVDQGSRWVQIQVDDVVTRPGNIAEYHLIVEGDDVPQCYKVAQTGTPSTDCPCADSGPPDTNPVNVTGLTPYKSFTFSVRAVNPGTCSAESGELVVITDQDIPGRISGLTVLETSDLEVSWTPPAEPNGVITSYTVRWCEKHPVEDPADKCMTDCCRNVTTSETVHVIGGLEAFFCYDVSVAASTIVGMGDFVDKLQQCTGVGRPFPAEITNLVAVSAFAIDVTWILDPDAYPTGDSVNYNATATAPGGSEPYRYALVKGFNTSSALIPDLEPYVLYTVVVIALANNSQGVQLETPSAPRDVRTLEFYRPEAVDTFEVHNGQPDSCHTFSFDWSAPSKPNGEITGYIIKYQQTSDPSDNGMKEFDSQSNSGSIECLNSNNAEYTFTIQAENSIGFGNESREEGVKSGICHPTSASDNAIGNSHVGKSKTSVTVEVNKCDICYNSNGDVTFVGLLVIEQTDLIPEETSYDDKAALDAEYGPWNNKGPGPGYRTTPDTWPDEVDCSEVISQCRGEQPGCTAASRRKRRAAAGTVEYTVGQPPPGGCQPDTYCNKQLNDGKKFMLRLVVGTAGGLLVAPSTDTFETDKNMAWVAGVVVPVVLVIVAIIVTVVIMYKRAIGPFSHKTKRGKEPDTISVGSTAHVYADIMDDTSITRPEPVPLDRFHQHVLGHQKASDWLFASEYKVLRTLSPMHSVEAAEHADNRPKNRFTNILPFDHSRVRLKGNNYDNCSDYINASYIPDYNSTRGFIACQSPMINTVIDFWCMIWDQNVSTIVMVAQLEERGREICVQYWPTEKTFESYGELRVETRSEIAFDDYILRDLEVRKGQDKRTVRQLQYVLWPDLYVPDDLDTFVNLVVDARSHILSDLDLGRDPVVVHCSAGVGRTGTYIAVDRLLQHIEENDTIDVFGIVMEMRNYRCYMVQTEAQYVMVHKCVQKALERRLHKPLEATGAINMLYANQHHGDKHLYENTTINLESS